MKQYTFYILIFFGLQVSDIANAQIVSKSSNSQNPGKEVATEGITSGSLSNDVNLFTGTLNTNYSLGTVSTLSGLSFTANLSYSSSFSGGDNLPRLSGVPYGEGWSLEVPMITISTEDYNKYTQQQLTNMANGNPANSPAMPEKTPTFVNYSTGNCDQAKEEGRLYWYAPTVNIPGVGGGRMVYKTKEGNEFVFVPNRFERYMEARLDLTKLQWTVITDDGTVYTFRHLTVQQRNPVNQRVQETCQTPDVLQKIILPKTEILSWYCETISHPNHVGQIAFQYQTYGRFDFMKTFNHPITLGNISTYFNLSVAPLEAPAKDIFITKIYSPTSELTFNYSDINTNFLGSGFTAVDDLYSKKTVYSKSQNSFNSWRRYNHVKSDEVSTSCSRATDINFRDALNPYVLSGLLSPTGVQASNGLMSYKTISGNPTSIAFKHGFIESPKISFANVNLVPGDIYEVAYNISGNAKTLFDINLATGDQLASEGSTTTFNGNTIQKYDCWNKRREESVFSTFNQAIKWEPRNNPSGLTGHSNFFVMPNLPLTHDGFYFQIGPANADIKYNFANFNSVSPPPATCVTYLQSGLNEQSDDNLSSPNSIIRSGGSIGSNFGIGEPWYMLKKRHNGQLDRSFYGANYECESNGFNEPNWWSPVYRENGTPLTNCSNNNLPQWPNKPTSTVSDAAALTDFDLIRYAKKPYMLTSVETRVQNSSQAWVTVSRINLGYTIAALTNYAAATYNQPATAPVNLTYKLPQDRARQVVRLETITHVPFDNSAQTTEKSPKTTFSYVQFDPVPPALINGNNWGKNIFPVNGSNFVLQKIIDPLGKITELEYYPMPRQTSTDFLTINVGTDSLSYMVVNYNYNLRPSELKSNPINNDCGFTWPVGHPSNLSGTLPTGGNVRMGQTYAYQFFLVVKTKKETDRDNLIRQTRFKFDSIIYNYTVDRPYFSGQFVYDYQNNTIKAGYKKATVEGPYYGSTPGGPVAIYRHHSHSLYWGKMYNMETKTSSSGTWVTRKRILYQNLLAYDRPWTAQNPLQHPDFSAISGQTTYDMPYFYETRYADAIHLANSNYLRSYFIKVVSDSTTNYETGGSYTLVNEYAYFDANYQKSTTSEGYKTLLGLSTLPYTLTTEPSWQPFRTKSYATEYNGASPLYTITERYYYYDLLNNSTYATNGVPNANFKNLSYVQDKKMRNITFETRTINKLSFTDGAKRQAVNTIYQKFFETGSNALTGKLLPTATWVQMDTISSASVMSFQGAYNFRAVTPWQHLLTDSVISYNQYNLAPVASLNVLGLQTTNTYNQYTGLPTQQEVGTGLSDALLTTYTYNTDNTLSSANYPNNLTFSYNYDKLKRPTLLKRNNEEIQRTVYSQFNNVTGTHTFQQRMALNYVRTTTFITGSDTTLTFTYFDPLGRTTGVVEDGTLKSNTHYDQYGRALYVRRPNMGNTPTTVMPASNIHVDYLQTQYDAAPRNRPLKMAKYGQNITLASAKVIQYQYNIIPSSTLYSLITQTGLSSNLMPVGSNFLQESATDEDGKTTRVITNFFGQKVAEITGNGMAVTLFYYNADGKVLKVVNSKGQPSTYRYNYLGQLFKKVTPDEGLVSYIYNKAGQVIVDVNGTLQARAYQYDAYGRMLAQKYVASVANDLYYYEGMGWRNPTGVSIYNGYFTNASYPFEKKWIYNSYDSGMATLFATATNTLLTGGGQTNTRGRLAQIISYNLAGIPVNIQLLSYTNEGFLKWEVQQFNETGITSTAKGLTTKLDYLTYNRAGSLIKENIDISFDGTLDMQYYRTYDKRNRLKDIHVAYTDIGNTGRKVATYSYDDATNLITKKNFYDRFDDGTCLRSIDSINYSYDTRYRLTRMNSRTLDYYLAYDGNQPPVNVSGNQTSNNYNGNINGIYVNYKTVFGGITNFTGATSYTYQYDALNRLRFADARVARTTTYSSLTANQLLYGDNRISYDRIGNIDTMSIWLMNSANTAVEVYSYKYNYTANKNALATVNKIAGANPGLDRTLTTDNAGRLTGDTKKALNGVTYRPSNLVWEHSFGGTNAPKVRYLYDAADRRIFKELVHNSTTTVQKAYYLYDALGHEIYIRDLMPNAPNDKHTWYVHGREREARFPDGRIAGGGAGLQQDEEDYKTTFRTDASRTDAYEIPYPSRLLLVSPPDTLLPVGYLLETEQRHSSYPWVILQAVEINRPDERLIVTDSAGRTPRVLTIQEIIDLRSSDTPFFLDGYDGSCATVERASAALPPQSSIDLRYYIYDHLGNTRVVYNSTLPVGCAATQATLTLEYAADYTPFGRILRSYTASGAKERFLTTGHERDPETGYDNRGARLYDADLARFLSVDPLAHEYPSWSPYAAMGDNPIKNIDPDGRKFINFDKDGNYTGTTKDNWWHNLWHGSKGRVMNDDGSVQQKFKFADPKNDVANIQSGKIKRLELVKGEDILLMVGRSGGFDADNKTANRSWSDRYSYIKKEGQASGKMDFSYSQIQKVYPDASTNPLDPNNPSPMIFLVDGVAHNHMNFGNFLFGASGEAMGFTLLELRAGAHWRAMTQDGADGYPNQLDTPDDQFSITQGFRFANDRNYHEKQWRVTVGPLQSGTGN